MSSALVSIIIPMYNVEKYLEECLDSICRQTYSNIEVICVEDRSTDNSLRLLKKYGQKDSRIMVIENTTNMGVSAARNRGFRAAKGKYVYYLDSDDYIKPNAIEELVYYAEEYDVECIYFDSELLEENEGIGAPSLCYGLDDIDKKVFDGASLFKIMREHGVYTSSVWRRFWRMDILKENKLCFMDELLFADDSYFSLIAMLRGKRMMVINNSYHVYRRREGTLSKRVTPIKVKCVFKCYCMLLEFWRKSDIPQNVEKILSEYLKEMLILTKREYFRLRNRVSIDDFESEIDKHLFNALIVQDYEQSLNRIDNKIVQKIKEYSQVIVYGAGNYASEVVNKLMKKDIKIMCLAVTKIHKNTEGIGELQVYEIRNLTYLKDDAIVVLGVGQRNKKNVIETLNDYGFRNYISLEENEKE